MQRYNNKVLFALVVAYKNGIINKNPLKRWIDRRVIVTTILKYTIFIIAFGHLLVMLNEGLLINLEDRIIVNGMIFDVYRLYTVLFLFPMFISTYKLVLYVKRMIFVNRSMSRYTYGDNHIQVLDKVTFKVKM
jgi:hypothetical protein